MTAVTDTTRTPWDIMRRDWWAVLKRTWAEANDDNIGLIAAGTAFYGFAAIVPLLAATVLTYGLIATPETVSANIQGLFGVLPRDAAQLIGEQLATVVRTSGDKKGVGLFIALVLAIYGGTKGASSLVIALNVAYEEKETRGFVRLNLLAFAITGGAVLLALAAVASTAALAFIDGLIPGAPDWLLTAIRLASYLIMAALATTGAACLYRFAPDRKQPSWAWLTPGSLAAMILWLTATFGFGLYVSRFGNYGATYGSLSAVVVLLTWLWLSAYVFLLGAELNSEIEHQLVLSRPAAATTALSPPPAVVPASSTAATAHPVASGVGIGLAARVAGKPIGVPAAMLAATGLSAIRRNAVGRGAALLIAAVVITWWRRDQHLSSDTTDPAA